MSSLDSIEVQPVAVVKRESIQENERDQTIFSKIVFRKEMASGLIGIEEFSHIYVIFWLHQVKDSDKSLLHHGGQSKENVGIFATRSPIHPNPIGLTVVELVRHEDNTIWVRGLDALDDTPVLDVKPYPDWADGRFKLVLDFQVPNWLRELIED